MYEKHTQVLSALCLVLMPLTIQISVVTAPNVPLWQSHASGVFLTIITVASRDYYKLPQAGCREVILIYYDQAAWYISCTRQRKERVGKVTRKDVRKKKKCLRYPKPLTPPCNFDSLRSQVPLHQRFSFALLFFVYVIVLFVARKAYVSAKTL